MSWSGVMVDEDHRAQVNGHTERRSVKFALWAALVLTTAAIVRVGMWRPTTPQPGATSSGFIVPWQAKGWLIRARQPAASTGEELSWAQGVELTNPTRHPGAVVSLVPVRARGPSTFTLETLVRPVLGESFKTAGLLQFGVHERARLKAGANQQSANQQTAQAACISGGIALADPERMVRSKLQQGRLTTLQQQLERLAGLRQTRSWDCLLVVVREPGQADSSRLWPELLANLSAAGGLR